MRNRMSFINLITYSFIEIVKTKFKYKLDLWLQLRIVSLLIPTAYL
jgi:hypothetical protein